MPGDPVDRRRPPSRRPVDPTMARREAGRALIRLWLGRAVGRVSADRGLTEFRSAPAPPSFSYACDGLLTAPASPCGPATPRLNACEREALVHLGGYAGA